MTKQETIKQHYITEFINSGMSQKEAEETVEMMIRNELIDENGWCPYAFGEHTESGVEPFGDYETKNHNHWRPISLHGIETNNNWTAILSEKDLPSADIDCWLELTNGRVLLAIFHFERQIFFGFNFPYTINEVIAYSEIKQPPKRIY